MPLDTRKAQMHNESSTNSRESEVKSSWCVIYKTGCVGTPYNCRANMPLPADLSTVSAILEVREDGSSHLHGVA